MKNILLISAVGFFLFSLSSFAQEGEVAVQALADKSDGVVVFFDKDGNEIDRFPAAFGKKQGAKEKEGDKKTPEGDYHLYPARPSHSWGWFMPIDYPNKADMERAERENGTAAGLGHSVGLHGTGGRLWYKILQGIDQDWTAGCIAVDDPSMESIRHLVTRPIPIKIQP